MSTHFNVTDMLEEKLVPGFEYSVCSLRAAWAWAVIYGGKDVESRPAMTQQRGRVLIHASDYKGSLREEQDLRLEVSFLTGIALSALPVTFARNAILGSVDLYDCAQGAVSKWAVPGRSHWLLRDPRRLLSPVLKVASKAQSWRWKAQGAGAARRGPG